MRQAKLIQDEIDAKSGGKVKSMKQFIEEYLPRKYGLPALVSDVRLCAREKKKSEGQN